jgi:hypothetical protein
MTRIAPSCPPRLTPGLRDFFGANTYGRIDGDPGKEFHTLWSDTAAKPFADPRARALCAITAQAHRGTRKAR